MNIVTIEQDFVALLADLLSLTVDTSVFRGGVPVEKDGLGVFINDEYANTAYSNATPRRYAMQILGKFTGRDEALQAESKIRGILPLADVTKNTTQFIAVSQQGNGAVYLDYDSGAVKYCLSVNLIVTVLTTGAQS